LRVGLLADIHGNASGLAAALGAMADEGVSQILVAGDLVGYYPDVNDSIDMLRSRACLCITGNHDAALMAPEGVSQDQWRAYNLDYVDRVISPRNRAWLASLPAIRNLSLGGRQVLLCHGSPWRVDEYVYPDALEWQRFAELGSDIVVMGHTHIPFTRHVGQTMLVNPGSCGQPRDYDPRAAFGILDLFRSTVSLRRVDYDVAVVQERVRSLGFDPKLAAILGRTRNAVDR
jgi:putative phosphoesterase